MQSKCIIFWSCEISGAEVAESTRRWITISTNSCTVAPVNLMLSKSTIIAHSVTAEVLSGTGMRAVLCGVLVLKPAWDDQLFSPFDVTQASKFEKLQSRLGFFSPVWEAGISIHVCPPRCLYKDKGHMHTSEILKALVLSEWLKMSLSSPLMSCDLIWHRLHDCEHDYPCKKALSPRRLKSICSSCRCKLRLVAYIYVTAYSCVATQMQRPTQWGTVTTSDSISNWYYCGNILYISLTAQYQLIPSSKLLHDLNPIKFIACMRFKAPASVPTACMRACSTAVAEHKTRTRKLAGRPWRHARTNLIPNMGQKH